MLQLPRRPRRPGKLQSLLLERINFYLEATKVVLTLFGRFFEIWSVDSNDMHSVAELSDHDASDPNELNVWLPMNDNARTLASAVPTIS